MHNVSCFFCVTVDYYTIDGSILYAPPLFFTPSCVLCIKIYRQLTSHHYT